MSKFNIPSSNKDVYDWISARLKDWSTLPFVCDENAALLDAIREARFGLDGDILVMLLAKCGPWPAWQAGRLAREAEERGDLVRSVDLLRRAEELGKPEVRSTALTELREAFTSIPGEAARTNPGCHVGLTLYDFEEPDVYVLSTPANAVPFATTGVDGDHFAVLLRDNAITDESPVVAVVLDTDVKEVVGENIRDFLNGGCECGWFGFRRVVREAEAYEGNDPDWLWPEKRSVLKELRDRLGLSPWPSASKRLAELADRFASQVLPPAIVDE